MYVLSKNNVLSHVPEPFRGKIIIKFEIQVANIDGESEFYETLVRARMKRLRAGRKDVLTALKEDLNKYNAELTEADVRMRMMKEQLELKTANFKSEIKLLNGKLEDVKKKQESVEKKIGLQGPTLIQCLTDIRTFAKAIEKKNSAFSPLVSILGGNFIKKN